MKPIRNTTLADVGLFLTALAWGSTFFIVKDSLDHVDPVVLVGYRFLLAALVLGIWLLWKGKNLFQNAHAGIVMGLLVWILYISQTIGLRYTTASNSGFITGLFVAFVPLFSLVFFRRKPNAQKIVATVLSLAGLWLLTGGLRTINVGDVITLLSAMAYAWHILATDIFVKGQRDPYVLCFQQIFVTGILSTITAFVFGLPFTVTSHGTIASIVFLALVPTLLAFVIQTVAQRITPPAKVALIFTLEPVFAAAFSWTLGGEIPHVSGALGGLLIVVAMVVAEVPLPNRSQER